MLTQTRRNRGVELKLLDINHTFKDFFKAIELGAKMYLLLVKAYVSFVKRKQSTDTKLFEGTTYALCAKKYYIVLVRKKKM